MTLLATVVGRGATGSKPAATAVPVGSLYYDTTLAKLQRSSGSAWEDCEGTASSAGGIPVDGWVAAGETWTYASADDPTYTLTIPTDLTTKYQAGMRVKLTQVTGGTKYFIITAAAYGAPNTTLTLYGGTDYNLENEAITSPYYSPVKAPFGFPMSPAKWTVAVTDTSDRTQATPTATTWYNLGAITIAIPIGVWEVSYQVWCDVQRATNGVADEYVTLSTGNNTESDKVMTAIAMVEAAKSTNMRVIQSVGRKELLTLAAKTSYYLNAKTTTASIANIDFRGDLGTTTIDAVCAYL